MASLDSDDANPASETLLCKGPFEVLRLVPGVFQPGEIKRQYRRLALILHPDKNRHPDAEAAFKKLTAAFEKLHDPAQQAASRAEATYRRVPRNRRGNSSSSGPSNSSSSDFGGGGGHGAGASSGSGGSGGEAPRWCREGEYVPEAKKEEEATTDTGKQKPRPVQEFWDDFEQQERVFKEEVAQSKERNAERKRAKSEARAAADQERMERLRKDVLGGEEGTGEVEAKTASWQKFNSTAPKKRKAARREKPNRGAAGFTTVKGPEIPGIDVSGGSRIRTGTDSSDTRVGHGSAAERLGRTEEAAESGPPIAEEKGAVGSAFVCWVCRRGFKSAKGLAHHEAKSELHLINVQLREFLAP